MLQYKDLIKDLDKITSEVASELLETVKENCPVDTGRLKSSLEKKKVKVGEYEVYSDCQYASFVEYGTIKMSPRKFMYKSVEEVVKRNV